VGFRSDKLYWTKGMYHLLEYNTDDEVDNLVVTPELYAGFVLKDDKHPAFEKKFFDEKVNNELHKEVPA
jgi:hypothetical protein